MLLHMYSHAIRKTRELLVAIFTTCSSRTDDGDAEALCSWLHQKERSAKKAN